MRSTSVRNGRFLDVSTTARKPTKNHCPAIWESMLGTVYAMNDEGEVRYFDYDHEGAREFANIPDTTWAVARDARTHSYTAELKARYGGMTAFRSDTSKEPRLRQMVLWVKMEDIT